MSEEPAGARAGRRRLVPFRRWSLRTRLVVALVALLAVVCAAVGVATSVALSRYQLRQIDTQLQAASARTRGDGGSGRQPPSSFLAEQQRSRCDGASSLAAEVPDSLAVLEIPGQAAGSLAVVSSGAQVDAGYVDAAGCIHVLDAADVAAVQEATSTGPRTVTVTVGALGDYRVVAVRRDDGDTVVTGTSLAGVQATQRRLAEVEIAVSLVALLAAGLAAAAIVRGSLRPLRRVAATATKVATLPLERGEVDLSVRVPAADTDPRTEVGQVGAALNTLLGHVGSALAARHDSELQVRQFVADASHELRTPLASIRGYAELVNRDPGALPPHAAYALTRVESEARRMTGLVEDLLLLARLDAGRPLDHEPVDLTQVVVDALSDAAAAGRDHSWRLNVPDDPVLVLGDAARLHQVLANLLTNARTHTPPGTTVTASLTTGGHHRGGRGSVRGGVVLAVLDDGPGIGADLLPHVFDRFARGDTSRSRAAGSSGLGLAIVSAIVTALGGSVDVSSRPGQTAFLVRLPAHTAAPATVRAELRSPS